MKETSLENMKCDECGRELIIEIDRIYCPEYYNEALGKKADNHDYYPNLDEDYYPNLDEEYNSQE